MRIAGIIPPGETFAITRAAADPTVVECANRTYDGGEPAGYVDPDAFLKQNGNDAFGVFYIGGLGDDTTAWIENGTLLMHWEILMMVPIGMFRGRLKQPGIIFFKENLMFVVVIQVIGILHAAVLMKVALKLVTH